MTREPWDERSLADWLQDGPAMAPVGAVDEAVAYARAHPRRRPMPEAGIWRHLMDRMQLTGVRPRSMGERSLAMAVAVATIVVAVAVAGAAILIRGQAPIVPIGASPSPSAIETGRPTAAPSATATPTVGASWRRVTDGALVGKPQGSLYGVIAGGPGVIAWGEVYGAGPRIWYSSDGRAWTQADVEAPTDYWVDQKAPGSVLSITPGGPGFVAVGIYVRSSDRLQTGLVWTSTDGRTWTRVPPSSIFDNSYLGQVVAWNGRLLAFGCAGCGMEGGPTTIWTSTDGISWSRVTPSLPNGIMDVGVVAVGPDRLWGTARIGSESPVAGQTPSATHLSSADGLAWTTSGLPFMGIERLFPMADAIYLARESGASGSGASPIYRSVDGVSWTELGGAIGPVSALVDAGGQLVAVGRSGPGCVGTSGTCVAAAWRSTDGGRAWTMATLGGTPAGLTSSVMEAIAMLPDGTLVAVGSEGTTPVTAAWVSAPTP